MATTAEKVKLWKHGDFLKLWAGETISLFGSQISSLALPITASLVLQASASQVAFLNTASYLPFLLLTLLFGLWVDRVRKRPLMVWSNFIRAILMSLIPLLLVARLLHIEVLYVLAFLTGGLTVVFNLAYRAYLPTLIGREHLLDGNTKLQASSSLADVSGPGLAGLLISLITAPFAILVDAVSFLVAGLSQFFIRSRETKPAPPTEKLSLIRQLKQGFQVVFGNINLRRVLFEAATYNFFSQIITALFVVYFTRELGLEVWVLGLVYSGGSVGALLGSLLANRIASWLGIGRAIVGSMLVACSPMVLVPLVGGGSLAALAVIMVAFVVNGFGLGLSNVYVVSLRQAITPTELMGRASAVYAQLGMGAVALGSFVAGLLEPVLGLRLTIACGTVGLVFAPLWVLFSPLSKMARLENATDPPN